MRIDRDDSTRISQLVMTRYPTEFIGYSAYAQERFRDGFNWAVEQLFNIEMLLVGEAIIDELGLRNGQWEAA